MKIPVNAEDYGLECMELAAAGAIKYQLENMETKDALVRMNNPAGLLWEFSKTINVNDLDTGTLRVRKNIVDYVKSIDATEVLDNPSEGFRRFIADCRDALEKSSLKVHN